MTEHSSKPVHVESNDDDLVARVAAIDVAKDSGMACTRVPDESRPGKRTTTVWSVRARTSSIIELADQLAEQRIERVVLEATSDYWRPFYYLLEARGLTVWLVNARDVEERPRSAQNGQARRHLAGQAQRARHAPVLLRAAGRDPSATRLHPTPG